MAVAPRHPRNMAKKSFKNAIDTKTKLGEKSGIGAVFTSTSNTVAEPVEASPRTVEENIKPAGAPRNVRQTFMFSDTYLEKLKDFVYYKKKNVDPLYTQKEAIHEAFDLLFESVEELPERPASVKKKEAEKGRKGR